MISLKNETIELYEHSIDSYEHSIERYERSFVVRLPGKRNVFSTSWLNGGYREDLTAVFNHQVSLDTCEECQTTEDIKTYLKGIAESLDLDPKTVCGLMTCAYMQNTAIAPVSYRDLYVCAIVTAGIDENGGRAGDPASYYENNENYEPVGGTINTILLINADLPEYSMGKVIMTATEAKAVALQQLMARSIYSHGIATGSGTDMIAIITDPNSKLHISDAGKHSKLGELIGKSVISATTEALRLQTGLSPESQMDVLARLSRFSVTEEDMWQVAKEFMKKSKIDEVSQESFFNNLNSCAKNPYLVSVTSAVLHIIDEIEWGLLPENEAEKAASLMIVEGFGLDKAFLIENDFGSVQASILQLLTKAISELVLREMNC
jgi:adenosylcobinamide hydrolase